MNLRKFKKKYSGVLKYEPELLRDITLLTMQKYTQGWRQGRKQRTQAVAAAAGGAANGTL